MNTIEWLSHLIAFDTTSHNSNLELIQVIQEWMQKYELETRLTYDAAKQKANLFATLPGKSGKKEGGLILSGHTDVVPVDGQKWNTNPFKMEQKDNKIYGRGTADMKGFLAVILALVPEFKKIKLENPLHFAFSYDEEVGCLGAHLLIDDLQKAQIKPRFCIVGEPTMMQPVIAHKGIQALNCNVKGVAAHSSLTKMGCNAIEYAAKCIHHLREMADHFKDQGPFDRHFDVPYTTISTNEIRGGNAHNIIPAHCEFFFEFRHLPEVNPQEIIADITKYVNEGLLPKMKKENKEAQISIDCSAHVPSFSVSEHSSLFRFIAKLSGEIETRKVAYATEAGLFQRANIETIILGPGSIEQAHRPDEYIELNQLNLCENLLQKIVGEISKI